MLRLLLLFFTLALSALAVDETRLKEIRGWTIRIPSDAQEHVNEGPDFSVTYFEFPTLKATLGIYEGGHPQSFASGEKDVVKKKDRIGGQDVEWSLWKQSTDGAVLFRAELLFTCATVRIPEANVSFDEKFHIFLAAPNEKVLAAVQDIVRTLKKEPNQSSQPTPGS